MPSAHLRLVVLCAFVVGAAPSFCRAQYTWVGGATGSGSLNFSNSANWSGGSVPSASSTTDFLFAGTANTGTPAAHLSQDIATVFTFRSITFDATAGSFFISSNKFVTDGGATITQNSANDQLLTNQFSNLTAATNTTRTLTLTGGAGGTGVVTLAGSVSDGTGTRRIAVAKSGASSTFVLAAPNSFTGGLNLSAGTLGIADSGAMGAGTFGWSAGTLSLQSDSPVAYTGTTTISGDVSLIANRATSGAAVNHVLGDLTLGANKLSVYAGGSVTSGAAGAAFGTTTLATSGATFDVGAGANLSVGTLSGSFSFTKQGAGTLTLSNQSTRNGNTSITGGTVVVTNATALGNGSSSTATIGDATLQIAGVNVNATKLTLNPNATLLGSGGSATYSNFNAAIGPGANVRLATAASTDTLTLSAAVVGGNASSNITVTGPGTVQLSSGSATGYAGSWNLNGTTTTVLRVVDANAFGDSSGARPITLTNGTLRLVNSAGANFTSSTTLAGNAIITPDRGSSGASITDSLGTLAVNDGLATVNTLTLTVNHGVNFTSNNTGSVAFGAVTLSDNVNFALNNTNGTAIGAATLGSINDGNIARTIGKSGGGALILGAAATSLIDGTAVNITAGTLSSNATGALGSLANVTLSTGATFNVGATQTIGAINSAASGTGTVLLNGNTLTVGSANNLDSVFAGTFSGSGNLAKQGNGRLALSGTNTYAGTTSVTAGKFIVNGTLTSGGGLVTVGDGVNALSGSLMGTGSISRSVKIDKGGTLAPGDNGVGILKTNDQTWIGGGTLSIEIGDASDQLQSSAGSKYDQLQINGSLDLTALTSGSRFKIDVTGATAGMIAHFDKSLNYDWLIVSRSGGVTIDPSLFDVYDHVSNDESGVDGAPDGFWRIFGSGSGVMLHYSAAPEPGTFGLASLMIMSGLLKRPRRRSHASRA